MKKFLLISSVVLVTGAVGVLGVRYYSYIFARTVQGEILRVERVSTPQTSPVVFAISVKDRDGEIVTASTTDRQWAVAQAGYCAQVRFFKYPPWDYDRSGTYFGARLKKLFECRSS